MNGERTMKIVGSGGFGLFVRVAHMNVVVRRSSQFHDQCV